MGKCTPWSTSSSFWLPSCILPVMNRGQRPRDSSIELVKDLERHLHLRRTRRRGGLQTVLIRQSWKFTSCSALSETSGITLKTKTGNSRKRPFKWKRSPTTTCCCFGMRTEGVKRLRKEYKRYVSLSLKEFLFVAIRSPKSKKLKLLKSLLRPRRQHL